MTLLAVSEAAERLIEVVIHSATTAEKLGLAEITSIDRYLSAGDIA